MSAAPEGRQRHFVDVWNPSYAADAMEAHLGVLLDAARRYERREIADEDLHVWWGKVRSRRRRQELKPLPAVLDVAAELERDAERECHLYLTDYTSLYVAHVDAIVQDDVRATAGAQVPGYYTALELECDFWYQLLDIRRLATDTRGVITELKELRNPGYGDMPVSLYGGMVDLPLVVYRTDGRRFFDVENRDRVIDGRLWAEFDAEAAKAIEVTCNAVLKAVGPSLPRELRRLTVEKKELDLSEGQHLALGQLAHVLRQRGALQKALRQRLEHGDWFVDTFPAVLNEVVQVRNPAVHRERIVRADATRVRDKLVGVGCQGVLSELARVRPR